APGPKQAPLREFLAETFKQKPRAEWEAWFADLDVCFAPVRTLKEAFDDPAAQACGMLAHDAEGSEIVGTPIRFSREPAQIDPALPEAGGAADASVTWR
ncbi:MAG TPA: CoA transferase, partial [Brevundimonas sp.]|nr:CoA transferase [Brevundimonas sp.]